MTEPVDGRSLMDLVEFARIEVASNDLEPWAALLRELYRNSTVNYDEVVWLVALYNTFDSFASAWMVARRWPSLRDWARAPDADDVAGYYCTQERRNLRGGRVIQRFASNVALLDGRSLDGWLRSALGTAGPRGDFIGLARHVRNVWGVGRQAAFEWVEFLEKVCDYPVEAPDAFLWESEGPRRSLQRLYGNARPTSQWLDERAVECRKLLADNGVALSWEDFETVICDFNVMRDGRYYPGRHLAALREEIDELEGLDRKRVLRAWWSIIPEPWVAIEPGIDKAKLPLYRDTRAILDAP